ncbi:MAG: hypothetical protein HXX10_07420 [Rhodoplanes sp.]|uniref:hypothetical protein n=1 Tax=Rhodoplanes sp. TaxID=1968906 RepID=UPI00184D8A45|nr:hypothetical protein [Rhodoplanes sp.]NVO13849.1 hypothetical protein [Rhodoplanes sp.]
MSTECPQYRAHYQTHDGTVWVHGSGPHDYRHSAIRDRNAVFKDGDVIAAWITKDGETTGKTLEKK